MPNIDILRMLALTTIVILTVLGAVWLVRRGSGGLALFGILGALVCLLASAAVLTISSAEAEQPDGMHVSVRIPPAEPYHPVPAPDPADTQTMIRIAGK